MTEGYVSSDLSREAGEISITGFDMLASMARKQSPLKRGTKRKSKVYEQSDYQKWLEALVNDTGMTGKEFEALSEQLGRRIPASSLRSTLRSIDTLSFKVIEYIALTCGKSPLYVMGKGLDTPQEDQAENFPGSLIETVWMLYKDLDLETKQRIEHYTLRPLIDEMRKALLAKTRR